jgi:hypothetical protein
LRSLEDIVLSGELALWMWCPIQQPGKEAADMRNRNLVVFLFGVLFCGVQVRSETRISGPYVHDNLSLFLIYNAAPTVPILPRAEPKPARCATSRSNKRWNRRKC